MYHESNRITHNVSTFIILAVFLLSPPVFSQSTLSQDSTLKIKKGSFIRLKDNSTFFSGDTTIKIPGELIKGASSRNDKTITFYDSLKVKASKTKFTRALFELVIVTPDSSDKRKIINRSDEGYNDYSGSKIRKIQIRRLNVFGANIDNPGYYNPHGIEKILNSTHVNTNENIIRKNLLFREGDTISPLKLSDNERILRQLPYIDDARIIVVPVSEEEADIIIITKDVYSLGGDITFHGIKNGSFWLFDKNIFGMGQEFRLEIPYSANNHNSPGIGLGYYANNLWRSFINMNINYYDGLGKKSYGINLSRNLISSETKYAGGLIINQTFIEKNPDFSGGGDSLKINYQDYWLTRAFLIDRESVTRFITGIRYINNNVFKKPPTLPDTFYPHEKYRMLLGSLAYSKQKYYKTNLIYSYGRTEDIPYGALIRLTGGYEINETDERGYFAADASFGRSFKSLGYFNFASGFGSFVREKHTEQGVLSLKLSYFSNLMKIGNQMIRNFVNIDYTRGFDRLNGESLVVLKENGFSGFSNDSLRGAQRVKLSIESVIFNPVNFYGFRFAFFGFADMAFLAGTNQYLSNGRILTGLGLGIRLRNDNLVFRTFQVRLGFFPSPPMYSNIKYFTASGEQLLRPPNFDPGQPDRIPYR